MNFHNEVTKLQERVARLEAKVLSEDEDLPDHLEPASEGFIETGAARPPAESKAGTHVQKGPAPAKPELKIYELSDGFALARGDERLGTYKTRKAAEKAKAAAESEAA